MSEVIDIPKRHVQAECVRDSCGGTCYHCCLAVCKVCNGFEGSLTTHCCGRKITSEESDQIYEEGLDFYNNKWVRLADTHPMAKNPMFR